MSDTPSKPTVHFLGEARFFSCNHSEYEYARVLGLDHPILGRDNIRTSIIVKKNDDGSFETLNTIYAPHRLEKAK